MIKTKTAMHLGDRPVIAELGHYALVLALGLALVQASVPMLGARKQ